MVERIREEKMTNFSQIQQTLQKKQQTLLEFEQATQQMLSCPAEQLEELVAERQRLLAKIDGLERELGALCQEDPDREQLLSAIAGQADAGSFPEPLQLLYEEGIKIRTVFSRLRQSDQQAQLRLKTEQAQILKHIKKMNQGANAKAARFYSGAGAGDGRSRLGNA